MRLTEFQQKLVAANLAIIGWMEGSKQYRMYFRLFKDRLDARQWAYIGLCRAAFEYEFPRGISFNTVAVLHARAAMQYGLLRDKFEAYRYEYRKLSKHPVITVPYDKLDVSTPDPIELIDSTDEVDRLHLVLKFLTPRQREVISDWLQHGCRAETARRLNMKPMSVQSVLKAVIRRGKQVFKVTE